MLTVPYVLSSDLLLVCRLEIPSAFGIELLLRDLTGQMMAEYNSKLSKLYFNALGTD